MNGRNPGAALIRCAALAMPALIGTPLAAQTLPPDESIHFIRYVEVRERVIPGYEAKGVPIGSFTLSPSINVATAYSDNVLALETGGGDDAFVRVAPAVQLQSNWSNRLLSVNADAQIDRYASRSSENGEALNLSAYGVQELGNAARLRLIGRYRQGQESRESQNAFVLTRRPVEFSVKSAAVGASKGFNHLFLSGEAGIDSAQFSDARLLNGTPLDQDYRDNDLTHVRLRADVVQSPSLAYFVQATRSVSSYTLRNAFGGSRESRNVEVLGGIRFELPVLVRGEIGIGYLNSQYRDQQFRSFSGLAINSKLVVFLTQLTTVTLNAVRSVNDAGTPDSSAYVALIGGIQVDHELLRSLILGANVQVERDSFNGADRQDRRIAVGASVDYRLNRTLSLRVTVDRLDLSSTGAARYKSFSRDRALAGIGLRI